MKKYEVRVNRVSRFIKERELGEERTQKGLKSVNWVAGGRSIGTRHGQEGGFVKGS